jgi:hypothetical protein
MERVPNNFCDATGCLDMFKSIPLVVFVHNHNRGDDWTSFSLLAGGTLINEVN